jgi:hypothetical protein
LSKFYGLKSWAFIKKFAICHAIHMHKHFHTNQASKTAQFLVSSTLVLLAVGKARVANGTRSKRLNYHEDECLDAFAGFIHGSTLIGSQEVSPRIPGISDFSAWSTNARATARTVPIYCKV